MGFLEIWVVVDDWIFWVVGDSIFFGFIVCCVFCVIFVRVVLFSLLINLLIGVLVLCCWLLGLCCFDIVVCFLVVGFGIRVWLMLWGKFLCWWILFDFLGGELDWLIWLFVEVFVLDLVCFWLLDGLICGIVGVFLL